MEVGLLMLGFPGKAREIARRTEAAGFSHLALGDTQNLGPETSGLCTLAQVGLEFVTVAPGSSDMGWETGWNSIERIEKEVIPTLQ